MYILTIFLISMRKCEKLCRAWFSKGLGRTGISDSFTERQIAGIDRGNIKRISKDCGAVGDARGIGLGISTSCSAETG